MRAVVEAVGDLVVRVRWTHALLHDASGKRFRALTHARRLRVETGRLERAAPGSRSGALAGRVVAVRLGAPRGEAERRALKSSEKKQKTPISARLRPRTLLLFTTFRLRRLMLRASSIYRRCRWQIELVFNVSSSCSSSAWFHQQRRRAQLDSCACDSLLLGLIGTPEPFPLTTLSADARQGEAGADVRSWAWIGRRRSRATQALCPALTLTQLVAATAAGPSTSPNAADAARSSGGYATCYVNGL